jgi:anti-sigma factor RsiW
MSCSQVRRELLEHFRFPDELGPRSGPHLAHLESCAECRHEVGIDLVLVEQLRRALRERVEGSAPSIASWDVIRRRTVDHPEGIWSSRVLRWGGMMPATAAAILMFTVAAASHAGLLHESQSPAAHASAEREVRLAVEATWINKYGTLEAAVEQSSTLSASGLYGRNMASDDTPSIPGRMR